ncbi:MAG: nucleoside triphosphate pyrophosphohydrolase [Bdellovibrionales bacterium]
MPITPPSDHRKFESLLEVMKGLRGPGGCPWDLEQTHKTLIPYAIEEACELGEAIESGDQNHIIEELGDVLLQVVFHAEMGRQENRFDIYDIIESVCSKLVRRHPHVFAQDNVQDSTEVLQNWEKIKAAEKKNGEEKPKTLGGPLSLPALHRSQKIGEKTKRAKFDWTTVEQVIKKLDEERSELDEALNAKNPQEIEIEMGDFLFTAAQLARHLNLDAEHTLRLANNKFEKRYFRMHELVKKAGKDWEQLSNDEKEEFWEQSKRQSDM